MPYIFLTIGTDAMEYFAAFLMGSFWYLQSSLSRMLVIGGARWVLSRRMGFGRKQQLYALLTGLIAPYLLPVLLLLWSLIEDMTGLPGMTRLVPVLLCSGLILFGEYRFGRRHITHPDPKRFGRYYRASIALSAVILVVFEILT